MIFTLALLLAAQAAPPSPAIPRASARARTPGLSFGGEATAADGAPVTLELFRSFIDRKEPFELFPEYELTVGPDQTFLFEGVEPGFYFLRAQADGHGTEQFRVELQQSLLNERISLARGVSLAGEVVAGEGLDPESLSVSLEPDLCIQEFLGAVDKGKFHFTDLAPGTYHLTLSGEGAFGKEFERRVEVELDESMADFSVGLGADAVPLQLTFKGPGGLASLDGKLIARRGQDCIEEFIRLIPWLPRATHQRFVGGRSGFKRGEYIRLDLSPGTWDLSFTASGFAPWSKTMEVEGRTKCTANLTALEGRLVSAAPMGRSIVEARSSHSAERWRTLLDHSQDYDIDFTQTLNASSAWLPPGTYDLRITTDKFADKLWEEVHIVSSPDTYIVHAPTDKGLSISGTIQSNAREGHDYDLYLHRLEHTGAVHLPCKRTSSHYDLKTGMERFQFGGLSSGVYQASLDSTGNVPVGTWLVEDKDLIDQRLYHLFR